MSTASLVFDYGELKKVVSRLLGQQPTTGSDYMAAKTGNTNIDLSQDI